MSDSYTLSIIIPHYNIPDLLKRLLDTIPNRSDIQIIVVDDNSPDDGGKLKAAIKARRNQNTELYYNDTKKNSAGTCRNIGMEHAKGKWIIFADADDAFMPGWTEKLESYFDSDVEIVYFAQTSVYLETGTLADRHLCVADIIGNYMLDPTHENEIKLKFGLPAALPAMYSRAFLSKINAKFSDQRTEEDKMFVIQCGAEVKKYACIPDALYCVTARRDSLTSTHNYAWFDAHQRMIIKRYEKLKSILPTEDLCALGFEYAGLQMLYTTIMDGYGIIQAMKYRKMQKVSGMPLMLELRPLALQEQLWRSLANRLKGVRLRKK